jgi:hypothetical protein
MSRNTDWYTPVGGAEGNGGLTSTSRGPRIGADSRKEHLRDPLRPESNFRESQKRMGEENGGKRLSLEAYVTKRRQDVDILVCR